MKALGTNKNGKIEVVVPDYDLIFNVKEYRGMKDELSKGGVYGFYHNDDFIYCGETDNIYRRMNEHFNLDKYNLSEFEKYKKEFKESIVCKVFFEQDFTCREIYESWIIRKDKPIFNILKSEKRYVSHKKNVLNEDLIIAYDKLYRDKLSINNLDQKNVVCEKNAVILSRMYMMSQMPLDIFLNYISFVEKKEFDIMWKFYKDIAIKNKLRPVVENGNLIFSAPFKKHLKVIDGKFVLEG